MEEKVYFNSGNLSIEGLLDTKSADHGLIITHPHPLHGGDMHNLVVDIVRQVFEQRDFTTLRFNFRGTGGSQGHYDNGIGEQEDVLAAVSFLQNKGIDSIVLAGYSFGAWVNALASDRSSGKLQLVMISPPVAFIDFKDVPAVATLKLIITGNRDEIAPAEQIRGLAPLWNPNAKLEIINGTDHFYAEAFQKLVAVLDGFAASLDSCVG